MTSRTGARAEVKIYAVAVTGNRHSSKGRFRISDVELKLVVYKQTQGKPCSRCKPNSVRSICHSPEVDFLTGDRASRSIVKARGQDNIFSALESKQG